VGDPAGSNATADLALRVTGTHKPLHRDKVEIPSEGGVRLLRKNGERFKLLSQRQVIVSWALRKKIKKDWMTQQTLEKIRERKNVKEAMNACKTRERKVELQNKYTEKNREVKKSVRRN
jgi:hypothetical protein